MRKIELTVEELPERSMFLNTHLGEGTLGETKFDASLRLPDYSLVVSIDKKRYLVSSQSIISEVVTLHDEQKKL